MDFQVCYPANVKGWTPLNNFRSFIVKETAGEEFVEVNNCVKLCCQDIDGIVEALKTLRKKMGENEYTTTQVDLVIKGLQEKRQDLVTKNKELVTACNQVVQYIYENKSSKSQEAAAVAQTIANINIYQG